MAYDHDLGSPVSVFAAMDQLYRDSEVVVDRPGGSRHPKYPQILYAVDYGYMKGTAGGDGQAIDIFRGSMEGAGVVGLFVTVDMVKKDAELKIVVDCTAEEISGVHGLLEQMDLPHTYIARS